MRRRWAASSAFIRPTRSLTPIAASASSVMCAAMVPPSLADHREHAGEVALVALEPDLVERLESVFASKT